RRSEAAEQVDTLITETTAEADKLLAEAQKQALKTTAEAESQADTMVGAARSEAELAAAAEHFGGAPLAMEVVSPDILDKSGAGGVRLDLVGEAALHRGREAILAACRAYDPAAEIEGVQGLTGQEVKDYIRWTADRRLLPVSDGGPGDIGQFAAIGQMVDPPHPLEAESYLAAPLPA
ncbi:acetate--CoA ligase family protein, partial [Vreelandella neptunia]|uniref:acetate--CoA ligase family protein n=1 Tax=Vreelandella neptunia TaxID=115551 RepID=UPI0025B46730